MVKRILKRYASLLMIAALVLATIPIIVFPAFAASTSGTVTGLSDANIGLTFNGEVEDPWSAGSTTITGSATNATTCDNTPKKESKLTIKNKSSSVAKLIFKYDVTLNSGSVTIDGTSVTSAGTFSKEIGAGGSIIVDLIAGDKSKATVVTLSDIQLILKKTVTATFKAPQHGSYTVNGAQITSDWVNTGSSFDSYTVSATPDSGYIFMGWYNAETMRSISTDASCSLSLNGDCTVMPKFVSNSAALFTAVGRAFDDIDEASEYAAANKQSTVILSKSGTYDKNSTVPSGMTLLIPFDAANTVYTTAPEYVETSEAQSAYRTLTLKSGATITVNGVLSVSGKHLTASTEYCSRPTGAYGHIKTEAGSKIIINSNAKLYAWGYISGEGEVIANSGSAVYEYFQIADWRGGSVTSSLLGNKEKVFPFSQYFVQNIEASLILKGGADEYTYLTLTAGSGIAKQTKSTSIHFVGKSDAMFNMTNGSELTKYYSPSTDRTHFITKGNVSLKSISLTVSVNTVDSSKYVLPINNNVSLEIKSGTVSICQDVALQPGVNITIDNGAEVKINKGYKLYVYDKAEWSESYVWKSSNGGIRYVYYTTTTHAKRTLTNTVLNVNGALTAEGEIYTTKSGAEIISDGSTGVFNQVSAPGKDTKTNQYRQSDKSFVSIPITAAKLKNVNGTFTETASASAGDSIKFVNKEWGGKEPVYVTVTFNPNFSGIAEKTQSVESGVDTKLDTNSFSRTGYTFKGWNTSADGSGTAYANGATVNISKDTVLYAQWEVNTYTVTWKNGDTVLQSTKVAYGTKPAYTGATPTKAATAQYTYSFKGWTPEIVAVTGDTTYTAEFNSVLREYTVTWKNGDTVLQSTKVAYGTKPAYTGATPTKTATAQYTYSFKGWSPEIVAVTGDTTYTAEFNATTNIYKVTWKNGNSVLKINEVRYGEMPTYSGDIPQKTATAQYTYVFKGWSPEVSAVTGDTTYNAVFDAILNEYTIIWKCDDKVLQTDKIAYGETPKFNGTTPQKEATDQYTYVFKGWSPDISEVTGDTTYNALFDTITNQYTVTWKNGDTVLQSGKVAYGERPTYSGDTPTKAATAQYTYVFKGWSPAVSNVTGDATYTAVFDEIVNEYTVTWKNGDTVLQSGKVAYGERPTYTGATPTKTATDQYTYVFKGWSPAVSNVTGDATYTAVFDEIVNEYTVTWKNGDTVLQSGKVAYGEKPAYTGTAPTKAATAQYTYVFKGWSPAVSNVTGDATYTAVFDEIVNKYTVTWKNGDTVLQSGKVAYGEKPAYTGATPTKAATAQYTYVFKGWSPAVSNVTGDATYTAVFDEIVNEYTVTWKNGDTVLATDSVPYGKTPVYNGKAPVKEETNRYSYSFKGWTPEVADVTGNATYTAVFEEIGKNGLCVDGSDTYWIMNGKNVEFPGLIRINVGSDNEPHYHYYYFAEDGKAVKDGTYKVNKNNGLPLPEFNYDFDADGVIVHDEDTSKNGICDGDGSRFYYVDGVKAGVGLIKVDDSYYYARTSTAEIVRDRTYWISNTNDLSIDPGMYHFDSDGRMILNGFVSDSDGDYYFVNGTTLKGFTKIGDDYYLFNAASGKMYKDATMWVGDNDYGIEGGMYYFAADGKMSVPDIENGKKAIVEKDGKLYFTIDGAYMTSGLYELDGEYYYAQSNSILAVSKTVWVDNKNGLIPEKGNWYAFDESGKLIKTGFVNGSDGYTYYYNDTVLALGFTKIGSDYYIFNSYSGKMYKNAEMWIGSNDYGFASSLYYFGADGKMSVPDTENGKKAIVEKDGKLYFTIDGAYMTSGLYELDGEYYYVQNNGELAANKTVWVDKKNGLIPEKGNWYAFDESGKLIKTGFVNGSDGYTYYYNDTVLALGFTKIGSDYYIFNSYSGKMYKDAEMWIGSNDYGFTSSLYYFGADGKMSVPDTENGKKAIVEKDGKLYFTIDGAYMTSGLYEMNGEYYYVQNNGELAANKTVWVDNKNGLIPEKGNWYAFDESGKLIKTGFVNGSDGYTYYYNDTVLALGFTKIGDDYYIFNSYSGKMYKNAEMWVGDNDYGIVGGMYYFDKDGKITLTDAE